MLLGRRKSNQAIPAPLHDRENQFAWEKLMHELPIEARNLWQSIFSSA
jgi:hypothetical protein